MVFIDASKTILKGVETGHSRIGVIAISTFVFGTHAF
jgi:hypothetical protein